MGYYSKFSVEFADDVQPDAMERVIASIRNKSDAAAYALDSDGSSYEETKWYECDKDCKKVALEFPDVQFCIVAIGEDLDIRFHYFHGNRYNQVPGKIIPEPKNAHFPITL